MKWVFLLIYIHNLIKNLHIVSFDVPFPAEIDDPSKGLWVDGTAYGKVWQCNYCNHQDQCVKDKANGF